jgi:subfamily B ATP-binding cassette protein HlyB/CyaB
MTQPNFSIGMLVAFQMFSGRVSQPMLRIVGLWQNFQQTQIAVRRLADIMNAPIEPYSVVPQTLANAKGEIEFREVSFRYREDLPFLYHGLNLRIPPGECAVLMGPSGCGKSTLAKLLQGFYLPSSGIIAIDGKDHRNLSANELRSYFGVVPQETLLFAGTIYDNLVLANPHATFDMLVQACKFAEIHDVIEKLPQGYQTEIGERGSGLSGGQRQRLAIARAILKRPRVLIFDEATSNLDPVTAEQFAATVNTLRGKVTLIFITHQLPKALKVDHLVKLAEISGQESGNN